MIDKDKIIEDMKKRIPERMTDYDFNKTENDSTISGNEKSSAKIQAELYEKDKRITFAQYCKFLLSLPVPMSYELWSNLHNICKEEGLE